ncbi:MAG: hypothetical protein HYI21_14015 [Sediminibacterium sp. Gen4]|jgi:hypothetical protein|uniref:S41 family peptidase n=1 Tax=unclassified Sediminibacterium TaxID=2635961 RepID=UPI0015BE1EE3|nr:MULTISPECIES: S41 family peptidase [unclassified Sediminibacterium]MBW0160332.1 hypothetical protein [Sediminibacterium sp.]MBW0163126.1 hypothetical protein [Sediminibacterium sp.]NWK67139.1 hypothetical protein [Sediminibacterium sp. Gen4]
MRFILFVCMVFISCMGYGQQIAYEKTDPIDFYSKKLSKQAIKEDIRFWLTTMEESHVNMYHSISREQMQLLVDSLLIPFQDSVTHIESILIFSRLGAALDEGHVGLVSSRITDSLYNQSLRFPFQLQKVTQDAWFVSYDISSTPKLEMNDKIISINHISVSELNQRFHCLFGGLDNWRKEQIASYSKKLLFLAGISSPFEIEAIKENGDKIHFTVQGFHRSQIDSITKMLTAKMNHQSNKPYEFSWLKNGIGYLNYRSMRNDPTLPFDQFLTTVFTSLNDSSSKGLVIDLRENGGGDSQLGERLLAHFNKKPYILAGGMKWKISSHYKAFLKTSKNYNEADNKFYMSQPDGNTYTYVNRELKKPIIKEPFFEGKVAFLIGTGTFSSANMLADGVVSYQLAATFGEPTGESPNDFGEMFNFMLPNSHVIARAASKMFTRANKDEKNLGPVVPENIIIPTATDKKQKKDPVLESAVNWILNK